MTGPVEVIIPLLASRPDLGGDFLELASPEVMATFLGKWSLSPSVFLLAEPLCTALGTDEEVPSMPLVFFSSSFLQEPPSLFALLHPFLQKTTSLHYKGRW